MPKGICNQYWMPFGVLIVEDKSDVGLTYWVNAPWFRGRKWVRVW
jgi:hypothetical protein